jgi:sugar/nucleoside kinase (ribokinase family)
LKAMTDKFDLLVIGEINPDLILQGDDIVPEFGQAEKLVKHAELTIGSSSVITACGAARLGLSVAFIGLTGDDEFGRFMLNTMQERGIDVSACVVDETIATGMSVILSDPEDRAILTYPGTMPHLRLDQIDVSLLLRTKHLHVGSYFLLDALRPDLPELFSRVREAGATVSLDSNWDPAGNWNIATILPHIDLFFPNKSEVRFISGVEDFEQGLALLAAEIPILAIKLGAAGGLARRGEESAYAPALPVNVIDTTGAGDSFNAGFLYGFINDFPLAKSIDLACACGSLSTRAAGGTNAQPTLAEALAALQQLSE